MLSVANDQKCPSKSDTLKLFYSWNELSCQTALFQNLHPPPHSQRLAKGIELDFPCDYSNQHNQTQVTFQQPMEDTHSKCVRLQISSPTFGIHATPSSMRREHHNNDAFARREPTPKVQHSSITKPICSFPRTASCEKEDLLSSAEIDSNTNGEHSDLVLTKLKQMRQMSNVFDTDIFATPTSNKATQASGNDVRILYSCKCRPGANGNITYPQPVSPNHSPRKRHDSVNFRTISSFLVHPPTAPQCNNNRSNVPNLTANYESLWPDIVVTSKQFVGPVGCNVIRREFKATSEKGRQKGTFSRQPSLGAPGVLVMPKKIQWEPVKPSRYHSY